MTTYTISQKGDAGSIHDIASALYDREIDFPKNHIYAVVLADYYGGKGYTTHRTAAAAIAKSREMSNYSHAIINLDGTHLEAISDDTLVPYC